MGLCPCDDRARASDDRSIVGHQDGNILLASQLDDLPSLAAPAEGKVLESAYDLYLISHASIVESFRGNTAGMLDHRRVGAVRPCGAGVEDHCLDAKRSPWSLPRYSCVRQVVPAAIRASGLSGNRGGPGARDTGLDLADCRTRVVGSSDSVYVSNMVVWTLARRRARAAQARYRSLTLAPARRIIRA